MTFGELIDQIAGNSGDDSGAFRLSALRWLNLTRSYIADAASWRTALVSNATITTAASTRLYALNEDTTVYEHIVGSTLYDETNDFIITRATLEDLDSADPDRTITATPSVWADAGVDANGARQIVLYPIPDGVYTLRFAGLKQLGDLTSSDLSLETDPYFGVLSPWSATMSAGIRYYHDLDTNEDAEQIVAQLQIFNGMIRRRASRNTVAPAARSTLAVVRGSSPPALARLDPSHYDNRGN